MASEHSEQIVVARWLRKRGVRFIHVPNGMFRTGREAAILKAMGVEAGVPDFLIFDAPFCGQEPALVGTALEMKRARGGRLSKKQKKWLEELNKRGWFTAVVDGADAARALLLEIGY
jgi:hypothetical protein